MMRRRVGAPLLRTAAVGGVAYMAGSSAAKKTAAQQQQDAAQNAQLADLQQQQAALAQQQYQAQQPMSAQQQPVYAQQPPAPQMATSPTSDVGYQRDPIEMLKQLGELKAAGVISDDEFQAKKAELLRQI